MVAGVAAPASAATKQDGLVNVSVGDVTILQDVDIAAAVSAAVTACDIVDATVVAAVLSAATVVDSTSRNTTVCRTDAGKVRITQN